MDPLCDSQDRRSGFTLIELLVVVGIIGLLASIAIPGYARYKRNGVDSAIESGLNSARIAMEAYFEANGYTYVGTTEANLATKGFRRSDNFELEIVTTTVNRYVLRGCQVGGNFPSFLYDSNLGKLAPDSSSCP